MALGLAALLDDIAALVKATAASLDDIAAGAVKASTKAVAVVVDRDTGARERIEAAGLPYHAALGLADLGLA